MTSVPQQPVDPLADVPLRRAQHVLDSQQGNATVLIHSQAGACFTLNEVGTRVWQVLADARTRAEVIDALHDEYDVPREEFASDVAALVNTLVREGLVCADHG